MPNPFAGTKFSARLGNRFTQPLWSRYPAPPGFLVSMMGAGAAWLHNIRAQPQVSIRLHDQTWRGTAREIIDPTERKRAADIYIGTTNSSDYSDYLVYHWSFPTRRKIEQAHRKWFEEGIPIVIELQPASQPGPNPL